ncbi:hypothetical protein [Streptomyces sp. NPDC003032]
MELLFLQLLKSEIQLPLHRLRTVASYEISAEADSTPQPSHRHRYIPLGVSDRVEHVPGDDHHSSRLQTHGRDTRKVSEPSCQFLVLRSMKPMPVRFQGLCSYTAVAVSRALVGPAYALRDSPSQWHGQLAEDAP